MFYQNWLIEVKFIVLGRICEKCPCLYISMCICISDVQYIYIYIYIYIYTYIHTIILYVCMPQDFRKWTASIFVFCLLWFLWVLAFWNQKVSLSALIAFGDLNLLFRGFGFGVLELQDWFFLSFFLSCFSVLVPELTIVLFFVFKPWQGFKTESPFS